MQAVNAGNRTQSAGLLARQPHTTRLLTALLLLGTAVPLEAQERKGLFVGLGLGWGTCNGCETGRASGSGFSGNFRIGAAIRQSVLLGVESAGWFGGSDAFGTLTGSIYVYPTKGLYLRGGLGFAAEFSSDFQNGFGYSFGAGYDIPIAGATALTPYANWMFGNFEFGGDINVLQIGLAINFY